jgi:hypothetical protein
MAAIPPLTNFPQPVAPPKKGKGCLFWGCTTLLVAAALIVVVAFAGLYFMKRKLTTVATEFTETTAITLPTVEISAEELDVARSRVRNFREAARANTGAVLELTARDINGLINSEPHLAELRGKVYITLDRDQIGGEISFPLERLWFLGLEGRYLNGRVLFQVETNEQGLGVSIEELEVHGKTPPQQALKELRSVNLIEHLPKNHRVEEVLRKIDSVRVENGVLKVVLRE